MKLKIGEKVPNFSLKNQSGQLISLSQFHGQFVLLYFYPKDQTPGCTQQACALQDHYRLFQEKGIVILGVSRQDENTHLSFRKEYQLSFDLLVDSSGSLGKLFGIPTIPILGWYMRKSLLISPHQKLIQFYDSVQPKTHAIEVLKDVEEFKKSEISQ